jgi:imidazolonepropionase-like amidohydrolase
MNRLPALAALALPLLAQTHAIVNARIVPVTSPPLERGTVVIQNGKIAAVGAKVAVPAGANRIDGAGLSVYPGWINAYTAVGLTEISSVRGSVDTTELGLFNPQAQAWVAVNPHSEHVRTARANGVTSVLVAPSGGPIAGVASVVNLFGDYPSEMTMAPQAGVVLQLPSRYRPVARGSAESSPERAETRADRVAEDLAKLKQYLREAKAYAEMRARQDGSGGGAARDNALEAMIPVMRGQRPVICPVNHFREIREAIELAGEFGLKLIISGGADAWKVADLLKQKDIPVIYTRVESLPRAPEDPYDAPFATPAALRKAGVRFAIATGATASDARNLPYHAALAAAYGLEREDALKAITQWPAELLGVADRVGSLEPGKLANLLVSKGDPLDVRSEIRYVFIAGKQAPLETRNTELYERFLRRR